MGDEIGRRLREIRGWRGLTLQAAAELAGFSTPYLSMIERGKRSLNSRATLEAIATALRVSPTEITGTPYAPVDPVSAQTHAALVTLETALATYDLGIDPEVLPRPWPKLSAAITHLTEVLRANADYTAQAKILPGLLAELHATYVHDPAHRQDALVGLIYAYRSAASTCKSLGVRGLPLVAAIRAQICAEELGTPEWIGYAAFVRGFAGGPLNRPHQYALAMRAVDQLQGSLADPNVTQVAGTLHLYAAQACAIQGQAERSRNHLTEAENLASRLPTRRENFGCLYFGPDTVGIWRVSLVTELGEGAKVAELARSVRPEAVSSKGLQASFYADLGRGLASERPTRERGVYALAQAEKIAPQLIRNNVFVRETVSDLLPRVNRDSTAGRELRGMAYRMGLAPVS